MKLIQGLTDQTKQQMTLVLDDGTRATWYLEFKPQQKGWFFSIIWGSRTINGQRLVASPNILRQFINVIPFGILIQTTNNLDPVQQGSFVDGSTRAVLLQGEDLALVETAAYNAPVATQPPIDASAEGTTPILPSAWGPAGGDLTKTYPSPWVRAFHTGSDTPEQLVFGAIADGGFLRRVGSEILSDTLGAGDVIGPTGAVDGDLAVFDGTSGKLLKDGGSLTDGSLGLDVASVVASIMEAIRYNFPQQAVGPTSGTISLDLSANNRAYVEIDNNCTFDFVIPTDSQLYWLTVKNTAGTAKTVAWPGVTVANGATLPASIDAGATLSVLLNVVAGSTAGIVAIYSGTGLVNPMTTLGDTLYGGAGGAGTRRAGSTTLRRKFFSQTGTGSISAAPVWADTGQLFNIADYGAIPSSLGAATGNVTAFNAARDAMLAAGGGTIWIPPGVWYIDSILDVTVASDAIRFEVAGHGMQSTYIVQNGAGESGIRCDLTNGMSPNIKNRCIVKDLALRTTIGTECGTAITIYYGESFGVSNFRWNNNSGVMNVDIDSNDSGNGGWNDGIIIWGASAAFVRGVCLFGGSGWNTGSGAGQGFALQIKGGVNQLLEGIYLQSWAVGIALVPQDGIGGSVLCPQGVKIADVVAVNAMVLLYAYKEAGGAGPDALALNNFLLDNGNSPEANHRGIVIEGFTPTGHTVCNGQLLMDGGIDAVLLDGATGGQWANVMIDHTGSAWSGYALRMQGAANGNTFTGCSFGNQDILIGVACGYNRINDTGNLSGSGGSVITDNGTGNVIGNTMGKDGVITLAGGAAYEEFNVAISEGGYSDQTPKSASVCIVDGTNFMTYDVTPRPHVVDGSTTATNYVIRVFKRNGTNTVAGNLRYLFTCSP